MTSTWIAERPAIPSVYGLPKHRKGLLPWQHVADRMTSAERYWISTASLDGRPHAVPVDAVWLDERLYLGGSDETRWMRDLARNPRLTVHLESATEVLILRGQVTPLGVPDRSLAERLAETSNEKYGYGATPDGHLSGAAGTIHVLQPARVLGWTSFPMDATRWRPAGDGPQTQPAHSAAR